MSLKDLTVRNAKPREKAYKLSDEKGLFLHVFYNGSRYWRFKYYFVRKPRVLALGVYPDVTLAEARDKRDAARKQVADGRDPGMLKKLNKRSIETKSYRP